MGLGIQFEDNPFFGAVPAACVVGVLLLLAGLLALVDEFIERCSIEILCGLDRFLEVFDTIELDGVVLVLMGQQRLLHRVPGGLLGFRGRSVAAPRRHLDLRA